MTNKNKSNDYYVFSDATLEQAMLAWQKSETEAQADQEENTLIAITAIPWLLEHMNQSGPIYMFTAEDLLLEMDKWKSEQIEAYPHQQQRIEESSQKLNEFFQSEIVTTKYKMMVKQ